jgi:hypothetical protein
MGGKERQAQKRQVQKLLMSVIDLLKIYVFYLMAQKKGVVLRTPLIVFLAT